MTGGADDVSRIIDKLADRVDRLENTGESSNAVATTEVINETVESSDDVRSQTHETEAGTWDNLRWNVDHVQ